MPHLKNNAELERKYGNMVRIVADTGQGGWNHFSDDSRGKVYEGWPNSMNMFDGFIYWSKVTGRNQVIPCLLYTSPSPRDRQKSRMPSSA